MSDAARKLVKLRNRQAVEETSQVRATVYVPHRGTVNSVDGGTAWVVLDGGSELTPCSMVVQCRAGDRVVVHIYGRKARVTGNLTSPATDDTVANEAKVIAESNQQSVSRLRTEMDAAKERADALEETIDDFIETAEATYTTKTELDEATGAIEQTVAATYLSKDDAASTYTTQSVFAQAADEIRQSVSDALVEAKDHADDGIAQEVLSRNSAIAQKASEIELAVSRTYATKAEAAAAEPFVIGSQEEATASWTGLCPALDVLSDGQRIVYWLPVESEQDATLELVLDGEASTGAVPLYYGGEMRLGTQYGANSAIHLIYRENVGGVARGWWADATYDSDTYNRVQHSSAIKAAEDIEPDRIIVGTPLGYSHAAAGVSFDLSYPILFSRSEIQEGHLGTDNDVFCGGVPLANSGTVVGAGAGKVLYLRGTVDGSIFTLASSDDGDGWLTAAAPEPPAEDDGEGGDVGDAADGGDAAIADGNGAAALEEPEDEDASFCYIPIGVMSGESEGSFSSSRTLYALIQGAFRPLDAGAQLEAQMTYGEIAELRMDVGSITSTVERDYATKDEMAELRSEVVQTADDLTISFDQKLQERAEDIQNESDGRYSGKELEGAVETLSENLAGEIAARQTYYRFDEESMTIGKSDSELQLELTNDRISFKDQGEEVAYASGGEFYAPNMAVQSQLRMNKWAWIPRSNDNLSLKWLGD